MNDRELETGGAETLRGGNGSQEWEERRCYILYDLILRINKEGDDPHIGDTWHMDLVIL